MGDLLGYRKKLGFLIPAFNTVAIADLHQIVLTGVTIQVSDFMIGEPEAPDPDLGSALRDAGKRLAAKTPDSTMVLLDEVFTGADRLPGDESFQIGSGVAFEWPARALFDALDRYGASQPIAVVSPFPDDEHRRAVKRIADAGYAVVGDATFNITRPTDAALVSYVHMRELYARATAHGTPEVVIQLGHNLPMARLAGNLEQDFGRPFLAINQLCLWHSLRASGVNDLLPGASRLFMDF